MDIRAAEISDIIRKQIEDYDKRVEVTETGTVLTAGDGIARVYGLSSAMAGELLEFTGTGGKIVAGMVLNLEEDNVGVALLGEFESIKEGDQVKRTGRIVEVPVGDELVFFFAELSLDGGSRASRGSSPIAVRRLRVLIVRSFGEALQLRRGSPPRRGLWGRSG